MPDERFAQVDPFDLENYCIGSIRRLDAELPPHEATVHLSRRGMRMMESLLPAYVRARAVVGAPDTDGRHAATMPAATPDYPVVDLLRFGSEIEIFETP